MSIQQVTRRIEIRNVIHTIHATLLPRITNQKDRMEKEEETATTTRILSTWPRLQQKNFLQLPVYFFWIRSNHNLLLPLLLVLWAIYFPQWTRRWRRTHHLRTFLFVQGHRMSILLILWPWMEEMVVIVAWLQIRVESFTQFQWCVYFFHSHERKNRRG